MKCEVLIQIAFALHFFDAVNSVVRWITGVVVVRVSFVLDICVYYVVCT
jgi:hypothetical protein